MEQNGTGKIFVVSGATSGIGLAVAHLLASSGAAVIGIGRSTERCEQAQADLTSAHPGAEVAYFTADLSNQSQIKVVAEQIKPYLEHSGRQYLDGLINNAGAFTYWFTLTQEGIETQWAVNALAPFLLTHCLLPELREAPMGRVVTVSSGSHYHTRLRWSDIQLSHSYNGLLAYKQTKLANVLFTAELNRRLGADSRLRAFAADPGLVKTDIGLKSDARLARWIWNIRRNAGDPPEVPARGIVYLALEPSIQDSSEIYWKDSQPKAPNPFALDPTNAWRLWEISMQMCGLKESESLTRALSEVGG